MDGNTCPPWRAPKFANKINGLQGQKSGPIPPVFGPSDVVEAEVFAGHSWTRATSDDGVEVLLAYRRPGGRDDDRRAGLDP
jgi:hypothetical protein